MRPAASLAGPDGAVTSARLGRTRFSGSYHSPRMAVWSQRTGVARRAREQPWSSLKRCGGRAMKGDDELKKDVDPPRLGAGVEPGARLGRQRREEVGHRAPGRVGTGRAAVATSSTVRPLTTESGRV